MKNLKNISKIALKGNEVSEISKKKEVNLQKNSTLYFQIGLILCLLGTYGLFEMNFKFQIPTINIGDPIDEPNPVYINFVPEPDVIEKKQPDKRMVMLTDKPPVVKPDNFVDANPADIVTPDEYVPETASVIKIPTTVEVPTIAVPTTININNVEKVPIFPGCESASNNAERMACMSEKLTKLIQKKFNTDLALDLGLTGVQKIQVQFKIDNTGHVTDIQTRSPYSQLEEEAERVVSKIPVMKPGMQHDTPVSVLYYLPIAFQVH